MGTRADFYVAKGFDDQEAEWLGSIAWDGYRDGIPEALKLSTTEERFRAEVSTFLKSRKDATWPNEGWPWPWDDTNTTDCTYLFVDGQVWHRDGMDGIEPVMTEHREFEWPDMSARKNVKLGGPGSGIIVITM